MSAQEDLKIQRSINKEKQRSIDLDKQAKSNRSESLNLSYSLVDSLKETLGITTKVSDADKDMLKVNRDINKALLGRSNSFTSISALQKEIAKSTNLIGKSELLATGLGKSIVDSKQKNLKVVIEQYKMAQLSSKELEEVVLSIQFFGNIIKSHSLFNIDSLLLSSSSNEIN